MDLLLHGSSTCKGAHWLDCACTAAFGHITPQAPRLTESAHCRRRSPRHCGEASFAARIAARTPNTHKRLSAQGAIVPAPTNERTPADAACFGRAALLAPDRHPGRSIQTARASIVHRQFTSKVLNRRSGGA